MHLRSFPCASLWIFHWVSIQILDCRHQESRPIYIHILAVSCFYVSHSISSLIYVLIFSFPMFCLQSMQRCHVFPVLPGSIPDQTTSSWRSPERVRVFQNPRGTSVFVCHQSRLSTSTHSQLANPSATALLCSSLPSPSPSPPLPFLHLNLYPTDNWQLSSLCPWPHQQGQYMDDWFCEDHPCSFRWATEARRSLGGRQPGRRVYNRAVYPHLVGERSSRASSWTTSRWVQQSRSCCPSEGDTG